MANVPQGTDPRAPNAPSAAGAAFNETLLAGEPARSITVNTSAGTSGEIAIPRKTLAETLRALPVAIQGLWVGLACIVLLVCSAAALRSLFTSNVGAAPARPAATLPTLPLPSTSSPQAVSSAPASAQPVATGTGGITAIGASTGVGMAGFGALAIRDRLPTHIRLRQLGTFMDDLERLLAMEPSAIDRPDVRKLIADAAVYGMTVGPSGAISADGQRVFTFLTDRSGSAGPDILYDLVTTRGGTRAATYAAEALKRDDIRARGTPALRIAWDLRSAPSCQAGTALFDRVKSEGDRRVLATLFTMSKCGRGPTDCCLNNDPAYKDVVRVISAKK